MRRKMSYFFGAEGERKRRKQAAILKKGRELVEKEKEKERKKKEKEKERKGKKENKVCIFLFFFTFLVFFILVIKLEEYVNFHPFLPLLIHVQHV